MFESSAIARRHSRKDIALSDMDILDRYFRLPKMPCTISSPLRDSDRNPSFRIWSKDGKVWWKDFGTNESGRIVSLLARLWNVTYEDAIERIIDDCGSQVPHYTLVRRYKGRVKSGDGADIKVTVRKWRKYDIEFWKSFGISRKMLEFCNVHPISDIFFEHKDGETSSITADKYAYAYFEWKDGKCTIKVYQPYSERLKWLSSHDRSTWDLWKQAMAWAKERSNDECIITSSRKDAMCLWQNLNVPAMALQGEGYIPKPHVMQLVIERFKNVYLWYDNDFGRDVNPGQDNAKKLLEQFPALHNICIPARYQAKDPSDLYKMYGKQMLKTIYDDSKL